MLSVQFSLVAQSCLTQRPMNCITPGFPVHHQLPELTQTHVHWVGDAIQPSKPLLSPFSFCLQSCPASGSFQMSQVFTSGGQNIGAWAPASILPMNIQGWFLLGLTGFISLLSKWLSRAFSNTTVQTQMQSRVMQSRIPITLPDWAFYNKNPVVSFLG